MSARSRPPYDPWRDVDGTPIPVGARVQQVAVAKEHGARAERLHQRGEVIRRGQRGRGHLRLYVLFEGETEPVSIRPHLVRVQPKAPPAERLDTPSAEVEGVTPMTAPDRPLTPGEALAQLFMANADRGANHANDELVAALRQRMKDIQALADHPGARTAREDDVLAGKQLPRAIPQGE